MKFFRIVSLTVFFTASLISPSLSAQLVDLTSESQFQTYLTSTKPLVVDFFATWCGVCKRAKPMVEQLARKHKDVNFILVDGDQYPSLRKEYGVRAFPTFVFFNVQGKEVDRVVGKDERAMENAIAKIKKEMPAKEPIKLEPKEPTPEKKAPIIMEEPKPIMKPEAPKPVVKKPEPVTKPSTFDKNIIELGTLADLDTIRAKGQPMVYDFYTVWCGPCKQMKPVIENELSKEYSDVTFVMIDAEKFPSLEKKYQVKGYPTFVFLDKTGNEVTRLSGGCPKMLMQGKLNQISSKKTNLIVMDEKEMQAKLQAEGKSMPQAQPQRPMPVETKPMKKIQPTKRSRRNKR